MEVTRVMRIPKTNSKLSKREENLLARLGNLNLKEEKQFTENYAQRQKILHQLAKRLRPQGR